MRSPGSAPWQSPAAHLPSTIPEIVPYLAFVLFKIPLPLTIIQILAVDLGTDMVPALALGAERPNPHAMTLPPRPANERLLNFSLIARAYLWLGLMQAAAAVAVFFFVLHRRGWSYGQTLAARNPLYLQATTACLSAIVVMQVVNVFLCRSRRESTFSFGLLKNPLLLLGILIELTIILIIDYTPWGNAVFGTAPIPAVVWLFIVPFGLGMLLLEELRKWFVRSFTAPHESRDFASASQTQMATVALTALFSTTLWISTQARASLSSAQRTATGTTRFFAAKHAMAARPGNGLR